MSLVTSRVSNYPVVGETCRAAAGAYNWVKETNGIGPLVQTAEDTAAYILNPLIGSSLGQKVDELAVRGILDPVEAICAYVKDTSSNRLISPAVNLAETCANLCLPEDKNPEALPKDASNYDRIVRLKDRTTYQALRILHASIDSSQTLLNTLSKTAPISSMKDTLIKVINLCELAYSSAKTIAIPVIVSLVGSVLEQLRKLNSQLEESKKLNWIDMKRLIMGLEHLKNILEKPESQEALELSTLRSRRGLAKSSECSSDPAPSKQTKP